ncbi:predicted protein [Micromonas commoda]|uniref:SET domain-containing protein n=1 Tax=Micromonas commoda (strain RCC299 / NOUM17 / CCMP2709) TaxID=296587 RepID=C1DZK9_MICCC|nr:predicted protein [Micromonas commoda]ACO60669.1 predicted protein [Micromonas commoda]|eukprot:XP_002499410.1 predicted protein [Micromonas commoda]
MDDDVIDERMAVMLLLILERRRGARSPAAPYVEAIPARFRTPLHYSDDETRGLLGTNLHAATSQQRKTLELVLRERVRPAGARLFAAMRAWERERRGWFGRTFVGGFTSAGKITEDEFRWAYSAYWSRALSLPIGADPSAPTVEAIVPGIDFANHSCGAPNARWEVRGVRGGAPDPNDPSGSGPRVELLGEFGSLPAPGEEVVISYGDKTNEELLFVHGFADRDNPHDALVLQPPWAVVLPAVPPARGLAGLDETTVDTLTLWGLSPKALEYELHAEAASERRVDEVVAADPLAPPVVKAAAVYRSGVARMTRRYANEAARWK